MDFKILFLSIFLISSNLVAGWNFDGCDDSAVTVGHAVQIKGRHHQAIAFNEGTYIQESGYDYTDVLSISVWFKTGIGGVIVSKIDSVSSPQKGYQLHINKTGTYAGTVAINCYSSTGDRAYVNSGNFNSYDYRDNKWHHVVGICNGKAKLYLDGLLKGESSDTNSDIGSSSQPLVIGERLDSSFPYSGALDELEIYNRELSATEILGIFNLEQDGSQCPSVVMGHWGLNNCDGNIAYDSYGNNNGEISGTAFWEEGFLGQTLFFNPENYVVVDPEDDFAFARSISMAAWVKTTYGGMIVAKNDPNDQIVRGFLLHMNFEGDYAGTIAVNCYDQDGVRFNVNSGNFNTSDYRDGLWHHVVGICDVENEGKAILYVDGQLVGSSEQGLYYLGINDQPISIGERPSQTFPFIGQIDEAYLYQGTLGADEIVALAAQEKQEAACPVKMLAHWGFDSCYGEVALDELSENDGIFVGSPWWVEGFINQALFFYRESYVEIDHSDDLSGEQGISIAVRAKTHHGGMIVSKLDGEAQVLNGYSLHINTDGDYAGTVAINCYGDDGSRLNVNSGNFNQIDYRDDQWHQYVAICDVAQTQKAYLYVDGQYVGSSEESYWNIGINEEPLTIGERPSSSYPFEGEIDEVRLYRGALDLENIQLLWNKSYRPGKCSAAPVALFIASEGMVDAPALITFDATLSYDADDSIVSYHWEFSDSSESSGSIVNHYFTVEGSYDVVLTVADQTGKIAKYSKTIIITGPATAHPNGGGYVSPDAAVSDEVFVASNSAVLENAVVLGNTYVAEGAIISANALVENSTVYGEIGGQANVVNNSFVTGFVSGNALVDSSKVSGSVFDESQILSNSVIEGSVFGSAIVTNSTVLSEGQVYGSAQVVDSVVEGSVFDEAQVINSNIFDQARIFGMSYFYKSIAFNNAAVDYNVENGSCSGELEYDQENCQIIMEE